MIIVDCRYKIPDCGDLGPLRYVVAKPDAAIVPLKQALHPVLLILDASKLLCKNPKPRLSWCRARIGLARTCGIAWLQCLRPGWYPEFCS